MDNLAVTGGALLTDVELVRRAAGAGEGIERLSHTVLHVQRPLVLGHTDITTQDDSWVLLK